ncbi:putative Fe-S oxidoreductase [Candidatus Methanoperedens nitroreducens]|uniref:Putative Fe-S oxidoreductase n=1 Tax=Candidatus Methanoperedens nitratireducens TaxID=1392998 RepID=A0A062VBP8_9EURY|nr:radical SAM protein [Candidatus Methanoperedens nitroreducens]KCZ73124.1 putative Fe-S oxidoreductase [Candidatus Methanoperedens nitroreducens]MDJ1422929.1 radical SAM protein [Candidatus Methanoperedens sp.]
MKQERWGNIGSKFAHLTSVHPCYNEKAHFTTARIHLPVAPRCNIQCNYCIRKLDKCEHRPGVSGSILNPQEALIRVDRYIKEMPNLRVVGIAGPGESLANEETFVTLGLVHDKYPELIKCVATNGLLLTENVEKLIEVGVTSVTVTINAVDPDIGARIYSFVRYHDKTYRGVEGAKLLIENQFLGVKRASEAGLNIKVNTVLIPEINFEQIKEIARRSHDSGATLMNIIPLIPLNRFEKERAPDCDELTMARTIAEEFLPQFRLCRQCRADAVGVPGMEPCGSPVQQRVTEYFHA